MQSATPTVQRVRSAVSAVLLVVGAHTAQAGINVWTSHGPPGRVNVLAIDPITPGTLYAGTPLAGVFKSTDGGGTWSATTLKKPGVRALAINPVTPSIVYAGTEGGVFKSTDGGSTWTASGLEPSDITRSSYITALVIDPTTPGTLYAGNAGRYFCNEDGYCSGGGLFKSTDGGGTWTATSLVSVQPIVALAIDPTVPDTLYAGTFPSCAFSVCSGGGVVKSTDGGATWSASSGLESSAIMALAIDPTTPGTLYAGNAALYWCDENLVCGPRGGGVFKSTDGGATWNVTDLTNDIAALAVDPMTPGTLYAGTDSGIFKSTDGGGTWSAVNTGLVNTYLPALAIDPTAPGALYAGTNGGVFKSTDAGGSWGAVSTGLANGHVYALAVDPATPGALYAGTLGGGVFKSTDGGGTWDGNAGLPNTFVSLLAIDPDTPSILYAGTGGGVFKSTDGGGTWGAANKGLPDSTHVSALAIDPSEPGTLYVAADGVYKSSDGGVTWRRASLRFSSGNVLALAIDSSTTPSTIYVGRAFNGVYKSTDGGTSWKHLLDDISAFPLAIDPSASGTLYAIAGSVLKSTDGGGSWDVINTGPWNTSVHALAIDPNASDTLYAATDDGVFKSTDGIWGAVNAGLTNTSVLALAVDPTTPSTLYAGTYGGGVFSLQQVGSCVGDCNDSGAVRINEVVTLVNIVLDTALPSACANGVPGGAAVDIALLVQAVSNALDGCESAPVRGARSAAL